MMSSFMRPLASIQLNTAARCTGMSLPVPEACAVQGVKGAQEFELCLEVSTVIEKQELESWRDMVSQAFVDSELP